MSDLISRKWLMECVDEGWIKFDTKKDTNTYIHLVRDIAPSAQRKGKWKVITDNRGRHAECPFCGEWKYHNNQKFCGECGAEMVKGEEDERIKNS